MTAHFHDVRQLFEAALDVPAAERTAWLRGAAGGDAALLAEVEVLLSLDQRSSTLLDRQAAASGLLDAPTERFLGTEIGGFRILRTLGSGGMGTVFEAEQQQPRRRVALKVMRHTFGGAEARLRFGYEAEILGRLQHPGIAQVYAAATFVAGGVEQPYFAMELIDGARNLDDFVVTEHKSVQEVLALVVDVCSAVHHGHQRGVVHRDLKPANILVDRTGQPKLIDFGIAKANGTEWQRTLATASASVVGTLAYMSPEQLDVGGSTTDIRVDIYAIGVVLFQLLTGRLPFDLGNLPLGVATDRIRHEEPPRASAVASRDLPLEVDWILQKAMAKDPEHRYASAQAFAEDLVRLQRREPVLAGPPSTAYRLRKFVARNRLAVYGSALLLLTLAGGTVATTLGWRRAIDAEQLAEGRRAEAERIAEDLWQVTALQSEILGSARGDRNVTLAAVIERSRQRFEALGLQGQVAASLHTALGVSFHSLGLTERAKEQFLAARTFVGDGTGSMQRVAYTLAMQHANLLAGIGELATAEAMLRDALQHCIDRNGTEHGDTATARSNLASVLLERGDFTTAEQLFRAALPILTASHGAQHPNTITAMLGLGTSLHRLRRPDEAGQQYDQACKLAREHLGAEDPLTLTAANTQAVFLLETGRLELAQQQFQALWSVRSRVSGPTHPSTLRIAGNLAVCNERVGNYQAAEAIYRQVLAARQADGGGKELADLITRFNLAVALHLQGSTAQLDEALATLQSLLTDASAILPADNWRLAVFQQHQGIVLRKLQRFAEAETALATARQILETTLGPANERTRSNWSETARLYEAWGKPEAAREWRQRLAPQ